jgi:hypothetical protein
MAGGNIALLEDRGVVSVTGEDAIKLLQGLITNDLDRLGTGGAALFAGLLSPQGKILFEFFAVRTADGVLLETVRDRASDLVKRLMMYRLRANATINDLSSSMSVLAVWGGPAPAQPMALTFADPRKAGLGHRMIVAGTMAGKLTHELMAADAYHAHRIALGVPEGGRDYPLGDTFPHEANYDLIDGVSFTKGCYVGQELVARMQNKAVVRKRVVRLAAATALAPGAEVRAGEAVIGTVGSAAGNQALALIRLDRAVEAIDTNRVVKSGGAPVTIDPDALLRYRNQVALAGAAAP